MFVVILILIFGQAFIDIRCEEDFFKENVLELVGKSELLKILFEKVLSNERMKSSLEEVLNSVYGDHGRIDLKNRLEDIFESLDYEATIIFEKDDVALLMNFKLSNDDSKELVNLNFNIEFDSKLIEFEYEKGDPNRISLTIANKDLFKNVKETKLLNFILRLAYLSDFNSYKGSEDNISDEIKNAPLVDQLNRALNIEIESKIEKVAKELEELDEKMKFKFSFDGLPSKTMRTVPAKFELHYHVSEKNDEGKSEVKNLKIFESESLFFVRKRSDYDVVDKESKCFEIIKKQKIAIIVLSLVSGFFLLVLVLILIMRMKDKIGNKEDYRDVDSSV